MPPRDEWDDLLEDDVTVDVLGKALTLRMPDRDAMIRLKQMQMKVGAEGKDRETIEDMASGMIDLLVEAISVCTGWPTEKAYAAYVRTGGENGELTRQCQLLCGMHVPDALAQEALDPNS